MLHPFVRKVRVIGGGEDCRIGALSLLLGGFTGGLRSFVTYVLILDDRLEEDNDQVLLFL